MPFSGQYHTRTITLAAANTEEAFTFDANARTMWLWGNGDFQFVFNRVGLSGSPAAGSYFQGHPAVHVPNMVGTHTVYVQGAQGRKIVLAWQL